MDNGVDYGVDSGWVLCEIWVDSGWILRWAMEWILGQILDGFWVDSGLDSW